MRLLDEKISNIIDTAHFRYVQLDGNIIRVYNRAANEFTSNPRAYYVEFDSEDAAKEKFDEISKEAGWFQFLQNGKTMAHLQNYGFEC